MNISTGFNRQIANPHFRGSQNVSKPIETEDKKGLSNSAKWGVGLGLTALAATGIYLTTRGKVKASTGVNSQADNIQKQINELKDKIKTNYLREKSEITKKYFDDKNFTLNEISVLHHKHANEGSTHLVGAKSINDLNYLIKDFTEPTGILHGHKSTAQSKIDKFFKSVKERLTELQKDSDWVELRKMRKQILKNRKARRVDKSIPKDPNEYTRLELINDALYSKYHGKKTDIMEVFDLSLDDILKLIKNPNTEDEYLKICKANNLFKLKPAITSNYPLRLDNFMVTTNYREAKETIKSLNERLIGLKEAQGNMHKELKKLAEKYHNSEDVKKLQDLITKKTNS